MVQSAWYSPGWTFLYESLTEPQATPHQTWEVFCLQRHAPSPALWGVLQYALRAGSAGSNNGLDLAEKFKENEGWLFENLSQDDYTRPPEGSYFHHVIEKRQRLEELYSEFINSGAGLEQEGEVFRKLVGELRNQNQLRELPVNGEGPTPR